MSDKTQPKSPREYYMLLYCKMKNISINNHEEAGRSWQSLTSAEKQIFINKFDEYLHWQANNSKRIGSILQFAVPFMKKRKIKGNRNEEVQTCIATESEKNENFDNIQQDIDDGIDGVSNTHSEPLDENIPNILNADLKTQDSNDNISIAFSESTNPPVYAASVIDTDVDETTSNLDINRVQSETLIEPIPPTVLTAEELFETLKTSGARPELADLEWKQVKKKRVYTTAVTKMKKEYLIKLEQYLESLSDPELFRYYIKTLNK